MLESKFKSELKVRLEKDYNCKVLPGPSNVIQGFPDLIIIFSNGRYALLEGKRDEARRSTYQPNQEYYLELFRSWCFCREIDRDNEEEIIDAMERALSLTKQTQRTLTIERELG